MGVALIAWGRFFDRHGNRITVPAPSTEPGVPRLLDFLSRYALALRRAGPFTRSVGGHDMTEKGYSRIDLAAIGFAVLVAAACLSPCAADEPVGTAVLTRSYDNGRTGANLSETHFTPALVTSKGLKRVRSFQIDDDPRIEAQPLYVPGAQMPDGKKHNVLFIASMGNHVWAFDVDGSGVWKTPTLGTPFNPPETQKPGQHRSTTIDSKGINILWGILSTPVIDADTNRMYVVNWITQENPPNPPQRSLFAHRIDLAAMQEVGQPLRIQATFTDEQGKPVLDAHGKDFETQRPLRDRNDPYDSQR